MTSMLHNQLIARTNDGGDGIVVFVPVQPLKLLGFEVVRLSGWQPDPSGGAMPPFSRGPGTSPPNFISVTVKGGVAQVRRELSRLGIDEGRYVPDYSQEAWVDSHGESHRPQRLAPGPLVEEGDDSHVQNKMPGVTTITCWAEENDFRKEIEAKFRS